MFKKNGFTLVELVVVIGIISILSMVVLFSVTQYINKSKDANLMGNLAVLVSSGEVYYNSDESYDEFCESSVVANAILQSPENADGSCTTEINVAGICCIESSGNDMWAACARLFSDDTKAYCVDSRGVKKKITNEQCVAINPTSAKCP